MAITLPRSVFTWPAFGGLLLLNAQLPHAPDGAGLDPDEPDVPDEPLEPEVPLDPDEPDAPDEPEVPLEPEVPEEPDDPEEPANVKHKYTEPPIWETPPVELILVTLNV